MNCVICHGKEITVLEVEEEIRVGQDIVFVPIRVPVCQTCGERYYDRTTMRHLEKIEKQLTEGAAELKEVGRLLKYG